MYSSKLKISSRNCYPSRQEGTPQAINTCELCTLEDPPDLWIPAAIGHYLIKAFENKVFSLFYPGSDERVLSYKL
jgi:hypothetical protein